MALSGLAIAAALGLAKSELVDRPKEERSRKLAARTQALSPWTGMSANKVQEADPFGTALQYGATGAQIGQNQEMMTEAKKNPWGARVNYNLNSGSVSPQQSNSWDNFLKGWQNS